MTKCIFVPTLVDGTNINAQVNNAREILAHWNNADWQLHGMAYYEPDPRVAMNPNVRITRLWRRHAWYLHMFLCYLKRWDMIFYPGIYPTEIRALRLRRLLNLEIPVITSLEGLVGNAEREAEYSRWAGHPVYCQHVPQAVIDRVDERNHHASHIIALSPFLEKMGRQRYGDKFSVLPLGINAQWFFSQTRPENPRLKIISAGGVKANKRPEMMLTLAKQFPHSDFIWYGDGDMRQTLIQQAAAQGLKNLSFPGPLQSAELGTAFRAADIFIMPSLSEGVPKVTQEAAACGLAQIVFGYYAPPSVTNNINGFVVWSDAQFMERLGELINDRSLIRRFADSGIERSREWHWEKVAKSWQHEIIRLAEKFVGGSQ